MSNKGTYYTGLVESLGHSSRFDLLDIFQDEVEELFGPRLVAEE
ncbi:MAG TPA: hypothetical protein VJ824_14315 [Bacillota bacterium]|nr:hypothetical protein [Bacillota bacterium]